MLKPIALALSVRDHIGSCFKKVSFEDLIQLVKGSGSLKASNLLQLLIPELSLLLPPVGASELLIVE